MGNTCKPMIISFQCMTKSTKKKKKHILVKKKKKTPFPGWVSVPSSFVSLFIFYILSYLPSKTMGCFYGHLMSSASDQKLFCEICSAFNCSFNEFVGEKVVSPSYSSAILAPPTFKFLIFPEYNFTVFRPSCVCVWVLSCFLCARLFVTLWTVACQASLSMGFSRQEYWNGLSCPSPGYFPNPGIKAASFLSPGLTGRFLSISIT